MDTSTPRSTPAFGAMAIHPKESLVLKLGGWLMFLFPLVPPAFVLVAIATKGVFWPISAGVVAFVAAGVIGVIHGGASFRHYRVQHLPDGLLVHRGVFWQSETFVPKSRIQQTEVNQGPLDRRWGMAKLNVHTAGTRLENIKVSGLHHGDALALRDALLDRREGVDGA
ncbi:MAG: PH domain-containing protein [Ahniella sp.]|nr:PH domain-containing protein [Ahniella sp.]